MCGRKVLADDGISFCLFVVSLLLFFLGSMKIILVSRIFVFDEGLRRIEKKLSSIFSFVHYF